MIFGIGTDIVEIDRIKHSLERFGMAFAYKILHAKERERMPALDSANCIPWLAARFAAKEAALKALGTGLRNGLTFKSIAVITNNLGKPELVFFDKALQLIQKRGIIGSYVSLSHERQNAVAFVVLEKDKDEDLNIDMALA